jgi:hypothetical protein
VEDGLSNERGVHACLSMRLCPLALTGSGVVDGFDTHRTGVDNDRGQIWNLVPGARDE